jgi:predicted permease
MQLHGGSWTSARTPLVLALVGRLLLSPLLALAASPLIGVDGGARSAAVLQSAMPSAVITIVLATEYKAAPEFVTAAVLCTTLLSPLTLTPILGWLGAG